MRSMPRAGWQYREPCDAPALRHPTQRYLACHRYSGCAPARTLSRKCWRPTKPTTPRPVRERRDPSSPHDLSWRRRHWCQSGFWAREPCPHCHVAGSPGRSIPHYQGLVVAANGPVTYFYSVSFRIQAALRKLAAEGLAMHCLDSVDSYVRHTEEIECRGDTQAGSKATNGKYTLLKHDPLSGRAPKRNTAEERSVVWKSTTGQARFVFLLSKMGWCHL